jgi:hypothetical protein
MPTLDRLCTLEEFESLVVAQHSGTCLRCPELRSLRIGERTVPVDFGSVQMLKEGSASLIST